VSRFVRNGCGGGGETRYAVELVGTNRLGLSNEKEPTQAVANLKAASILRDFIRFIRGHIGDRNTGWSTDRLLALFDRGGDAQLQNKKAPYKDNSRYELRHPTSERGSLSSCHFVMRRSAGMPQLRENVSAFAADSGGDFPPTLDLLIRIQSRRPKPTARSNRN
jgi:hypothetical protein